MITTVALIFVLGFSVAVMVTAGAVALWFAVDARKDARLTNSYATDAFRATKDRMEAFEAKVTASLAENDKAIDAIANGINGQSEALEQTLKGMRDEISAVRASGMFDAR